MCESKDYRVNRASFANGVLKNMLSTRRLSNAILFSVYFLAFILRQRHIKTNAETIFETFNRTKRVVSADNNAPSMPVVAHSNRLYENNNYRYSTSYSSFYWHKGFKWPWIARLHFNGKRNKRCGGVLIARNIIITAAHCVKDVHVNDVKVFVGDYHVNNVDDGEQMFDVNQIIINPFHRSYVEIFRNCGTPAQKGEVDLHDIAIVVLSRSITCNRVNNILLLPWRSFNVSYYSRRFPSPRPLNHFSDCHVAGWGATYHLGPFSNVLLDTKVHLLPMNLCNSTCFYEGKLKQGMLCAGDPNGRGADACQGDSGGPLMCKYDDVWFLVGLVSWGFQCGDKHKPGIYADVAAYQNWILKALEQHPKLEAEFWNSLLQCKKCLVRLKECKHKWQKYYLRKRGIKCPRKM